MTDTSDSDIKDQEKARNDGEPRNQERKDQKLGMHRGITRRDFVNGVAVGIGALSLSDLATAMDQAPKHGPKAKAGEAAFAPEKAATYYPPAKMGMRGNHDGSFKSAHQLRDGDFWEGAGKPEKLGETYDLVVVGGGISGLALSLIHISEPTRPY